MKTRKEAVDYCLKLGNTYEDYPFRDKNWTLMRHKENKKVFAWIFEKEEHIWVNVKCEHGMLELWRQVYESVVPAFHLNKDHWNSIILDGTIPNEEIYKMIKESYHLTKTK
ncbi:MmcQ/YjbR family DNA-binding protein [Lysinibacillus halotolerans]|uniref:MmcQ/YjbR family DNA-binding protein n=1 Tax=Lysinibacillus halotolerans TaxID=1368476 RepID=A0A3M8HFJ4_9BACI|nr:MmcQ/YjbR family DNA-binding protein [Lysinibacillus halotolerans]RND01192.1 MmcQ/YjbR family DNA-binding protein [Lysinibacillus halotolerans]